MNAELVLRKLAEIRRVIPQQSQPRIERQCDAMDDFELAAVAEALETMAGDLAATIAEAEANLRAHCLDVYYAAEEFSRDPAHAHLVPRVEEMRRAYERSYGTSIPSREA